MKCDDEDQPDLGDSFVIPKGTLHSPVAAEEYGVVLIETTTTLHNSDIATDRTRAIDQQFARCCRLRATPYTTQLTEVIHSMGRPSGALTRAERVEENGTIVDARGARLYHHVIGSGGVAPLVVVNGGPGFDHDYLHSSNAWSNLAKTRRVVFYDQRGTGRSPTEQGAAMDLASQVDDLDAIRAHVGAERMDLLGHSWGGYLVMAYAARHPERVSHLVIVDSAAPKLSDTKVLFDDIFPEVMERRRGTNFAQAMGDMTAEAEDIHLYLSMLFYSSEKRDQFLANAADYHFASAVSRALRLDLLNYDLTPELGKFRMPTLVVTGRHDMNVAPLVAWNIHRAIAGSRLLVFERSGHMPFFEEPGTFVDAVETFLEAVASPSVP